MTNISIYKMDNSIIIKDLLEPLITFNLLEISESLNKIPNKHFNPLFKMLRVYKNYLDNTNNDLPENCLNSTIWDSMIISKTTVDYLYLEEILCFINIIKLIVIKNQGVR